MKILVIGYSGSGKSTFAKKMAVIYESELLHMDKESFLPGWIERKQIDFENSVNSFLDENQSWVIDGNYSHIANRRYAESDQIFFFKFNRIKCIYGAIKRRIKYRKKSRDSAPEGCNERLGMDFIWWILFKGRSRARKRWYKETLEMYKDKSVIFKKRKTVNAYIEKINNKMKEMSE